MKGLLNYKRNDDYDFEQKTGLEKEIASYIPLILIIIFVKKIWEDRDKIQNKNQYFIRSIFES